MQEPQKGEPSLPNIAAFSQRAWQSRRRSFSWRRALPPMHPATSVNIVSSSYHQDSVPKPTAFWTEPAWTPALPIANREVHSSVELFRGTEIWLNREFVRVRTAIRLAIDCRRPRRLFLLEVLPLVR